MNLFLTTRGRWLLALGLLYCLTGALMSSPILIIIGQIPIVLLVVAIFLYLPGAMTLDRRLIQLRLHPADNPDFNKSVSSTHVVGDDILFMLEITNDSSSALHEFRATPFTSACLEFVQSDIPQQPITIYPASKIRIPITMRASRAGRRAIQGFDLIIRDPLGLIECIDYLPANHVFECYPAVGRMRRPNQPKIFTIQEANHPGRPSQHPTSNGSDIRELRDYNPGEPLKNIAWKASARARKLIARDFEADSESNLYVVLDISGTMRAQQRSNAPHKLDRSIEYVADLAQTLESSKQPLGLITFDERLYAHIVPNTGSAHLRRILNHLTTLNSIAEPDRTELDEAELLRLLADYLLIHERLDFRTPKDGKTSINTELLDRWLQNVLPREIQKFSSNALTDALIEHDNTLSPARRFLQLRGVALPFRGETRHGLKERSLSEAIELLSKSTRQPQQIIVITDLLGIVNLDLLTRTIKLARSKGHHLQFLIPDLTNNPQQHVSERYKIIHELFTATETEDRQKILQHLQTLSIPTRTLS